MHVLCAFYFIWINNFVNELYYLTLDNCPRFQNPGKVLGFHSFSRYSIVFYSISRDLIVLLFNGTAFYCTHANFMFLHIWTSFLVFIMSCCLIDWHVQQIYKKKLDKDKIIKQNKWSQNENKHRWKHSCPVDFKLNFTHILKIYCCHPPLQTGVKRLLA